MQIKERCWRYDTVNGAFFVKFYGDDEQAEKVRVLHQQLAKSQFPYCLPITSSEKSPYIVQRWIDGEAADYEQWMHRKTTLHMLENLHALTNGWTLPQMPRQRLVDKWRVRLQRFQQQEKALRPLIGTNYDVIVRQATNALQHIQDTNPSSTSVLHGDVVHHNFILGEQPMMIDFDLACIGDPAEEVILWMHRVLPHVKYDVEKLLVEHPYTNIALPKLHYLRYPNEVLREWLYVLQVEKEKQAMLCDYVGTFTEEMLSYSEDMMAQINRLIR